MKNCGCECASETRHDERCELALMGMSKARFVDGAEGGVEVALESYKTLIGIGFTEEDALESVLAETRESATCFAGIGSCGGGGCKHA